MILYKRVRNESWEILANLPPRTGFYEDDNADIDEFVYEYRLETINGCNEIVETATHNNIVLNGFANEELNTITLNWTLYDGWQQGVRQYEVERRLENSRRLYDGRYL